jgi:hypothetical protein
MESGGTKLPLWGKSSTLIVMILIVNIIFRHVYESKRIKKQKSKKKNTKIILPSQLVPVNPPSH